MIVVDPPWGYVRQSHHGYFDANGRRCTNPYPKMTQDELKAIKLPDTPDCVLFLWTTQKFIWDAKELLVADLLKTQEYIIYQPSDGGAHGFDGFAYKDGKFHYAFEVKTKPKCSKYPETGFEERLYERYMRWSQESNLPVMIFFVDENLGEIYGNYLHELYKPYIDLTQTKLYPKVVGHTGGKKITRYFPMKHMKSFAKLSDNAVATLKRLSRSDN